MIIMQISNFKLAMFKMINKIAIQGKGPYAKWTRKPLACRELNIFNICITCPPEICVNLVFLSFLNEKTIFLSIFSYPFNILKLQCDLLLTSLSLGLLNYSFRCSSANRNTLCFRESSD